MGRGGQAAIGVPRAPVRLPLKIDAMAGRVVRGVDLLAACDRPARLVACPGFFIDCTAVERDVDSRAYGQNRDETDQLGALFAWCVIRNRGTCLQVPVAGVSTRNGGIWMV